MQFCLFFMDKCCMKNRGNKMKNFIDFICYASGDSARGKPIGTGNRHDESYKLAYVYAGSGSVTIDKTEYALTKGSSFLAAPYTHFAVCEGTMRYVWVEFSGLEAAAMTGRVSINKKNPVVHDMGIKGFERFFDLQKTADHPYEMFRSGGKLMILFSYYYERYPGKSAENEGYVMRARHIIEERYTDHQFGVNEVAAQLKIDRSHLYRLFMDEMGTSVINYICRRRILRAEILLSDEQLSIKDVAYSSGFADQMYFSRMFKKLNGKTPTQFRESLSEKRAAST